MGKKLRHFRNRIEELWRNHKLLIIVLAGALLFDTLTTIYFMIYDGGIEAEIHPLVRHSALLLGPVAGTFLSAFLFKIVVGVLLAAYLRSIRILVLTTPAITSILAGFFNLFG